MHTQIEISERLSIRRFRSSDYDLVCALLSDEDTLRYTGFRTPQPALQIETLLEKWSLAEEDPLGVWAVDDRRSSELIGWVMLKPTASDPELGYMILKNHWNKGYATELSRGMLQYAFETLGLKRVIAAADSRNKASLKVLERVGMRQREISDPEPYAIYFEIMRRDHEG